MATHYIAEEQPSGIWNINTEALGHAARVEPRDGLWDIVLAHSLPWVANGRVTNMKGFKSAHEALDAFAAWGNDVITKVPLR